MPISVPKAEAYRKWRASLVTLQARLQGAIDVAPKIEAFGIKFDPQTHEWLEAVKAAIIIIDEALNESSFPQPTDAPARWQGTEHDRNSIIMWTGVDPLPSMIEMRRAAEEQPDDHITPDPRGIGRIRELKEILEEMQPLGDEGDDDDDWNQGEVVNPEDSDGSDEASNYE